MEITHFSFSPAGGASKIIKLLLEYQHQQKFKSKFIYLQEKNLHNDPYSHPLLTAKALMDKLIIQNKVSKSLFSYFRSNYGFKISNSLFQGNENYLHFHWMPGFLNFSKIQNLISLPEVKHAVWTFQDMWPFTGGCHYSFECSGFMQDCKNCPQVKLVFKQWPSQKLNDKRNINLVKNKMSIVAPSDWLRKQIELSSIFRDFEIINIPNPVNVRKIVVGNKRFKSNDKLVIGIVAADLSEKRKNIDLLINILLTLNQTILFNKLQIVVAGKNLKKSYIGVPNVLYIGEITESSKLDEFYQSINLHITLSENETFGYTIAESSLFEVPSICLAQSAGSELIENEKTGFVVKSPNELVGIIKNLIENREKIKNLGQASYRNIVSKCDLNIVGNKYFDAYTKTRNSF
jgi:glycosyltransferase involved in cell wall biosynthesis